VASDERSEVAIKAPEPGRFERGVFIPKRLDGPDFPFDLDDPDDVLSCRFCAFRSVGLAAIVRHGQQEHGGRG